MTLVHKLYGQFRHLIHEGAKFLVVGGLGLLVTNAVYGLMRHYSVGPITATTVATIVATLVTYFGNRYWSFRHRERTGMAREGLVFLLLNAAGLLIQDAVVGFNAYALGFQHGHKIEQLIALNVGIAIATVFRFWSYRKWVWAAPAGGAAVGVPVTSAGDPGRFGGGAAGAVGHVNGHAANGHAINGQAFNGQAAGNGYGNAASGRETLDPQDSQAADRRR